MPTLSFSAESQPKCMVVNAFNAIKAKQLKAQAAKKA
jgi:predicted dinucleotide-binding enzyme